MLHSLLRVSQYVGAFLLLAAWPAFAEKDKSASAQSVEIQTIFIESAEPLFSQEDPPLVSRNPYDSSLPEGVLSLSGVLTREQLDTSLKKLKESKDVEILSPPPLFARSERRAKLLMTQEVRYATEYELGKKDGDPPTPTRFDTREVGLTLEALPTVGPDGYTIDLELIPRLTRLIGYQAPGGQPVYFKKGSSLKEWFTALPAEFPVDETVQPILSTREVTTHVTVYSGSSVLLGGMKSKDQLTGKDRYWIMVVSATIVPPTDDH